MEQKYLDFKAEIKNESDMSFEAYGATFGNVDSDNDVVLKGAFLESLSKKMPKLFYQHDTKRIPGVINNAVEDSNGLLLSGKFIDTQLGRDVYQEIKSGAIDQMSMGFSAVDVEYEDSVRKLKKVNLFEVSFVTFPANDMARVISVKADQIETVRDLERALCDIGFSKERAKAIASGGFKTKSTERDAEAKGDNTGRDAGVDELKNLITELTKKIEGV